MRETIERVDDKLFERVWKLVTEIGVQERHFNGLQSTYRYMASAWLLATFGAMGFALTQKIAVAIDYELLLAGMALAGCAGIVLLWILDMLVYQRLLDACFVEGLILEKQHSWLPSLRSNMIASQRGRRPVFLLRVVGFYLAPVVLLLVVATGAMALWLAHRDRPELAVALALGGVAVACAASIVIYWQTHANDIVERRLGEAALETGTA